MKALGLPFWLAGSYASPSKLQEALTSGAQGIQVGTAFAFCEESGIDAKYKKQLIEKCLRGETTVLTDAFASPTGFPFKVVALENSLSEENVYQTRERLCDLGYLRQAYRDPTGKVGFRCPAEPIEDYLSKGGLLGETANRKCVCNGLMATIGLGQIRKDGSEESPIITAGDDVRNIGRFIPPGTTSYHAGDVVRYLLGK
jgi:NAD(P)H-dependent flavin oxidoreductase YrpB (nitropropane dioxygenase family)